MDEDLPVTYSEIFKKGIRFNGHVLLLLKAPDRFGLTFILSSPAEKLLSPRCFLQATILCLIIITTRRKSSLKPCIQGLCNTISGKPWSPNSREARHQNDPQKQFKSFWHRKIPQRKQYRPCRDGRLTFRQPDNDTGYGSGIRISVLEYSTIDSSSCPRAWYSGRTITFS
jgi:hypothetical protein